MKTIAIAGTFDTKGEEYLYIKGIAEELGLRTFMIHTEYLSLFLHRMCPMRTLLKLRAWI